MDKMLTAFPQLRLQQTKNLMLDGQNVDSVPAAEAATDLAAKKI
jgi:hypothetical protein